MGLIANARRYFGLGVDEQRLSLDQWAQYMSFGGVGYGLGHSQTITGNAEEIPSDFGGLAQGAMKSNGVVFSCMQRRLAVFSQAHFQFQQRQGGQPGRLFGTAALAPLEIPWPGGTTSDLLARAIQDVDLAGNFFCTLRKGRIVRLRPDWMSIVLGGPRDAEIGDLDVEVVGYAYKPGGPGSGRDPVILRPEQVAHFHPTPDPLASYRGMSWLTPIVREIIGDSAARDHKIKFFENGGTPNLIVKADIDNPEKFQRFKAMFAADQEGLDNAYKTLFMATGMDAQVVGSDFKQIDFKVTQGAGETRICMAAGVPPVIAGSSEGLEAATYSNYGMARRSFADGTIRPLWDNFASSMEKIIPAPGGARLFYDDAQIPFVQEDKKDDAEIKQVQAASINTLITAGFEPTSAVEAVTSGDFSRLKHTGLTSVQLLEPGSPTSTNGTVPMEEPLVNAN